MLRTRSRGLLGHYAGFASRFVALMIDSLIVVVSIGAITVAMFTIQSLLRLAVLVEYVNQLGLFSDLIGTLAEPGQVLASTISTVFLILYHVFFLSTAGRTPGKALMGLRVVTTDGKRLTVLRAVLRLVGYIISAVPAFAGFGLVLVDDHRQALHDKLAGTYVIYAWEARPDEQFLAREIQNLTAARNQKVSQNS